MATTKIQNSLKNKLKNHTPSQCDHKVKGQYIHYKPVNAREGKSLIQVYNNDGLRELIVPAKAPTQVPAIWRNSEFQRLQKQAYVSTNEEKLALIKAAEENKIRTQAACNKRKELLEKAQVRQFAKNGSKLNKEQTNAADRTMYVLQSAFELRQEQEDEVKKAASLIIAAKCLSIRQAQITEKELMKKELLEEERRLDMMMEQQREKEIKAEEDRKQKKRIKDQKHSLEVSQQISDNKVLKLIEIEQKEQESRRINKAIIGMQREDNEKIRIKHIQQMKINKELRIANEGIQHFKLVQKEEERIAELRVEEFIRRKDEREAVLAAGLAKIKAAKERGVALLQAQQQGDMEKLAAKDELMALRVQKEVEHELRQKQKAAALKRRKQEEELARGREQQLEDIRKAQAMEIEKDRREFYQIAKVQTKLQLKDVEKKRLCREAAVKHRKELLEQINAKEREHIQALHQKFEEGTALRMEQEVRNINIENVLRKKMQRLRTERLPENYVKNVERQMKLA